MKPCKYRQDCKFEGEFLCKFIQINDYVPQEVCESCPVPQNLEIEEKELADLSQLVEQYWKPCKQRKIVKTSDCCVSAICDNPKSENNKLRVFQHQCEDCPVRKS